VSSDPAQLISRHGLLAVLVGTFLEGEGVLLAASVAAARGLLSPVGVWLTAAVGAWAGHLLWFSAGRRFGSQLLSRSRWLAAKSAEADRIVEAHPKTAIFLLQYLYGVRMAGALALGLTRLSWRRFSLYEAVNCLVWAALLTAVGYLVGSASAEFLHGWIRWAWAAASLLVLLAVVHRLTARSLDATRNG
jgi:membrane-associated protein